MVNCTPRRRPPTHCRTRDRSTRGHRQGSTCTTRNTPRHIGTCAAPTGNMMGTSKKGSDKEKRQRRCGKRNTRGKRPAKVVHDLRHAEEQPSGFPSTYRALQLNEGKVKRAHESTGSVLKSNFEGPVLGMVPAGTWVGRSQVWELVALCGEVPA